MAWPQLSSTESTMIANGVGIVIGIASISFAVYQHRQRVRVESVVRETLRRLAGDIRVVQMNATWANSHLRNVGHSFAGDESELNKIKKETFDAARDATSCMRLLGLIHSQIRGIQQSLFRDTVEILPELKGDDVRGAESMLANSSISPSSPPLSSSNPQSQQ